MFQNLRYFRVNSNDHKSASCVQNGDPSHSVAGGGVTESEPIFGGISSLAARHDFEVL